MRLIDADGLKEDLKQYFTDGVLDGVSARLAFNQILHDIDNAPTVETYTKDDMTREYLKGYNACKDMNERPQGEWIPVSERLPEFTGLYLISVDDVVTVANFTGTYFMHRGGGRVEVYAWQPLPEPYKKGI